MTAILCNEIHLRALFILWPAVENNEESMPKISAVLPTY
jgi:hypothetical protein